MSFGSSSTPEVVKAEPVDDTAALEAAAKLEAERLRKKKGMKSTWLTSDDELGVAPTQKATLLSGQ